MDLSKKANCKLQSDQVIHVPGLSNCPEHAPTRCRLERAKNGSENSRARLPRTRFKIRKNPGPAEVDYLIAVAVFGVGTPLLEMAVIGALVVS